MSVHYVDAFMKAALREAARALSEGEVPVGCVFVTVDANEKEYHRLSSTTSSAVHLNGNDDDDVDACVAARGRNQTNVLHHALAHAEFIALQALLGSRAKTTQESTVGTTASPHSSAGAPPPPPPLLPPAPSSSSRKRSECLSSLLSYVLYVTVEPCVMCGAMLLYNEVGHVFFGCRNPRFGGNGTVLTLQEPASSSFPREQEGSYCCCEEAEGSRMKACAASASPVATPDEQADLSVPPPQKIKKEERQAKTSADSSVEGRGASVSAAPSTQGGVPQWWPGYISEGGHRAEEAIALLQQFYNHENPNAPGHKRRQKTTAAV